MSRDIGNRVSVSGDLGGRLVVAGGVDVEDADDPVAGEDRDVAAVFDDVDGGGAPAGADVNVLACDLGDTALVDDDVVDGERCGQRPLDRSGGRGGGEGLGRGATVQGAVWSAGVVVLGEDQQAGVDVGELGGGAVTSLVGAQPLLQRLPEPFDLAAGLGVIRGRGDRLGAQPAPGGPENGGGANTPGRA